MIHMDQCPLNHEPTVSQFAALDRARRTGKASNPKWYRDPATNCTPRLAFKPGQPPRYPNRFFTTLSNETHRAQIFESRFGYDKRGDSPKQYVKNWDKANGLKPCPITWVSAPSYG